MGNPLLAIAKKNPANLAGFFWLSNRNRTLFHGLQQLEDGSGRLHILTYVVGVYVVQPCTRQELVDDAFGIGCCDDTGAGADESAGESFAVSRIAFVLFQLVVTVDNNQGVAEVVGVGKGDAASGFVTVVEVDHGTGTGLTIHLGGGVAGSNRTGRTTRCKCQSGNTHHDDT